MPNNPRFTSITREQWAEFVVKNGKPNFEAIKALERLADEVFRVFPGSLQEAGIESDAAAVRAIGIASGLVSAAASDAAQDLSVLIGRIAALFARIEEINQEAMPRYPACECGDADGAAYSLACLALAQVSALTLGSFVGVLAAVSGGTGQSSYAIGDLLYANSTTTLSRLAGVATGNALISGGVGVAPLWGKIGLTTHASGILPAANGGKDTQPLVDVGGMNFNGSTTYLDSSALAGIVDGKAGTFFAVVRFAATGSGLEESLIESTGNAFRIIRQATGNIQILAENAAGTTILSVRTNTTPCVAAGTYRIKISWNLAVASSTQIYVDGVAQALTVTTDTNDTIDYTVTEYAVGARETGASRFVNGDLYLLWLDTTAAMDFSSVVNVRKFLDVNLVPNFLGARGELPTGNQPVLFLGYGKSDSWWINRGYGSGNFTLRGTIADASTALSGQYMASRLGYRLPYRTTETTLTLAAGAHYTFTGSGAATWTLPTVSGNHGLPVRVKNAGSADVTVQRAGADNIYDTSSVTSVTIAAGAALDFFNDSSVWQVV